MAVITFSRQFGSGGDEIVEQLCQMMSYSLLDKRILERAADEAGITDQEIIDSSEADYKVKNLWERLFGFDKLLTLARVWNEDPAGASSQERLILNEEYALALVRKAVEIAYKSGKIVIVGRGGQIILKNRPGVLHVRVVAELEDRILRTCSDPRLDSQPIADSADVRRKAQDLILKKDQASAEYLRRFYNVDWDDPYLYHLIVNTSKVSLDSAVRIIAELMQQFVPTAA